MKPIVSKKLVVLLEAAYVAALCGLVVWAVTALVA